MAEAAEFYVPQRWMWCEIRTINSDNRDKPDAGWSGPQLVVDFLDATNERQAPIVGGEPGQTILVPGRPGKIAVIAHHDDDPERPEGPPTWGMQGPSTIDVISGYEFRVCDPPPSFTALWKAADS